MKEKEIREYTEDAELSVASVENSRTIEGYGIVFNKQSVLLGGVFSEIIKPEAVDGVIERSDILALINHDVSKGVLARSTNGKGTMSLTVDSKGVKYNFDAPNYELGNELIEGVKRGDIRTSSFAFTVAEGGDTWQPLEDGTYLRVITKFEELYDMSPCYREAYSDTTVALRSLTEIKAKDEEKKTEGERRNETGDEPETPPVTPPEEKHELSEANKKLKRRQNYFKHKK
jgi:uncharacterized protein